jgi:hypothetical protein
VDTTHESLDAFRSFNNALLHGSRAGGIWNAGMTSVLTERSPVALASVTFIAREGESVPLAEEVPE